MSTQPTRLKQSEKQVDPDTILVMELWRLPERDATPYELVYRVLNAKTRGVRMSECSYWPARVAKAALKRDSLFDSFEAIG